MAVRDGEVQLPGAEVLYMAAGELAEWLINQTARPELPDT